MRIPDGMIPLIGWRAWNVSSQGLLIGQAHSELWPPYRAFQAGCYGGATEAHLLKGGQFSPSPVAMCSCGIHCYKTRELLENRLDSIKENYWQYGSDYAKQVLWGSVKIWGTIIEHDLGYRAEYAYPYELTAHDPKIAKRVASMYGIDCRFEALPEKPEPEQTVEDILTALLGRRLFNPFGIIRSGSVYYVPSRSQHTFWRNTLAPAPPPAQPLITPSWTQVQAYGAMVGASRWQQRQLVGGRRGGKTTDWLAILKGMVYLDPKKTEEEVDKLTLPSS